MEHGDKNRGIGLMRSHAVRPDEARLGRNTAVAGRSPAGDGRTTEPRARRILRELDRPKLDIMERYLNGIADKELRKRVQATLVDESYHGAFADADLNDPRNEHLFKKQTAEEKRLRTSHANSTTA